MVKKIPFLLIFARIFIAIIIGLIAFSDEDSRLLLVVLIIVGLLTDIFDGIVARKLNVSNEKLRVWDSNVDQFFWIVVLLAVFYLNWEFLSKNIFWILSIVFLEGICYLLSWIKFRKPIATHSILAKIWTLTLFVFLIDLLWNSESHYAYILCVFLGIVSRLEIILIILRLKKWTTDVPSLIHVEKINQGIPIKKSKWFNS